MTKENLIRVKGKILESKPNATFVVELENDIRIMAFPSGNIRRFRIRIIPGDMVDLELDRNDVTKGRIVYRYR